MNMALYMKTRREFRRNMLIKLLGGRCKACNSSNELEFDHINPYSKSFLISGSDLDKPMDELVKEVNKCQLLCKSHHKLKTSISVLAPHGTYSRYAHRKMPCRCDDCKKALSVWHKSYRQKRKQLGLVVW